MEIRTEKGGEKGEGGREGGREKEGKDRVGKRRTEGD